MGYDKFPVGGPHLPGVGGGGGAQVYVCGLLTSRNGYTATNASEGSITVLAVCLEINNLQSR